MEELLQKVEMLEKTVDELSSILKSVPDIIYRLDSAGRIIYISESIRQYGYSPEELQGKAFLDLVHPDDKEHAAVRINERRTGERSTKLFEVRLVLKSMNGIFDKYFSLSAEGLYFSKRHDPDVFIGTQGIARDITDKKKAREEQLRCEKLQGVLEMAGAVCHELSQPMQNIVGYSQLLKMEVPDDSSLYDKISRIINQIDRMREITRKIMGVTKYETKDYSKNKKIIDIEKSSSKY